LIQVSLSTREREREREQQQQRARGGNFLPKASRLLSAEELFVAPREFESSKGEGKKEGREGKSRPMIRHCRTALHCIQRRRTVAAPHHSFEKSWARANVRYLCFYCSAFSIFLFENHHSITENSGSSFHAFFSQFTSLSLIIKKTKLGIGSVWVRVEKKTTECCIGFGAFALLFDFCPFLFLFFCLTTCTGETQRRFTGSDGWNCPSSFLIISRLRLSAKLNLSSIQDVAGSWYRERERERERDTRAKYMCRRSKRGI
jgi:Zn-finger protein